MNFTITIMGSGAAIPTFTRHCSAQLVNINGVKMLLDCGESTQNYLRQYHVKMQSIRTVFLSHLHGDHFFGLPGLISTMHLCGRTEPLTVYAPKGIRQALEMLFQVSGTELRYELNIVELDFDDCRIIHQERSFRVKAFPLHHSVPTFGYVFEEEQPLLNLRRGVRDRYDLTPDECLKVKNGADYVTPDGKVIPNAELTNLPRLPRRYAYCCDTAYNDDLLSAIAGVDLLCAESTFDNAFQSVAEEKCHLTAAQAARLAANAGVGQLLLTHFSARYKELEPLLQEALQIFPNTVAATDGMVLEIPFRTKS